MAVYNTIPKIAAPLASARRSAKVASGRTSARGRAASAAPAPQSQKNQDHAAAIATVQWPNAYAAIGVHGVVCHSGSLKMCRKYSELAAGHERDLVFELRDYEASGGDLDAIREHIDDAASARVWEFFLENYKCFLRTGDDEAADEAADAAVAALSLSEPDAASAMETGSSVHLPPRSSNGSNFTRTRTDRSSVVPESLETDPDLSFCDKRGRDSDPKEELLDARLFEVGHEDKQTFTELIQLVQGKEGLVRSQIEKLRRIGFRADHHTAIMSLAHALLHHERQPNTKYDCYKRVYNKESNRRYVEAYKAALKKGFAPSDAMERAGLFVPDSNVYDQGGLVKWVRL